MSWNLTTQGTPSYVRDEIKRRLVQVRTSQTRRGLKVLDAALTLVRVATEGLDETHTVSVTLEGHAIEANGSDGHLAVVVTTRTRETS